jgi:glycosyltransferase involved in cell wall biosynthesis
MRILLISAYGLPHTGGIEVIVDELASRLAERGNEVTHVTSAAGAKRNGTDARYRVRRVRAINALETRLGVPYPIFGPGLLGVLGDEIAAADVVHAHGFIYPGTVAAFTLAQRARPKPPLVLTEHVGHVAYDSRTLNGVQRATIRVFGRHVLQRSDAVVTYNERVGAQLARLCPSIERETILNGVDHRTFHPPTADERRRLRSELGWDDRPRALFVGRPVAKKGFPIAVSATESVGSRVQLVVAGSQRLPRGAPQGVEALGRLSRPRLAEVYRACDLALVPSWGEGFPLVAQEALASGLPLILAEDPGYGPNLDGVGEGARLVDGAAGFAAAIAELAEDPGAHERARAAAAAHAESAFSWARATAQHEDLYRRLIDRSSPSRD